MSWLPPLLRFVTTPEWHETVEERLRSWCRRVGPELRRVSVQITHWTATIYSDAQDWLRLAGIDWRPVFPRGSATVEVYVSGELPEELEAVVGSRRCAGQRAVGVVDLAGGRCWIGGVVDYRGVRRAVFESLTGRILLGRGRTAGRDSSRWLGMPVAALEWARVPGRARGVGIVGPHRLRTLHAFLLVRYCESAALAAMDWCFFRPRQRRAVPADGHFLVPGRFVHWFPRLRSTLALAEPAAPVSDEARRRLLALQLADELDEPGPDAVAASRELAELLQTLAANDNWLLVSPDELVGPERIADTANVQSWLVFPDGDAQRALSRSGWLLRAGNRDELREAILRECFAYHCPLARRSAEGLIDQLLGAQGLRVFLAEPHSHPALMQLLIRFALSGRISGARWLDEPLGEPCAAHLQLAGTLGPGYWQHASGNTVRLLVLEPARGDRPTVMAVDAWMLERGELSDPFGLIRGVWPGQIADFFTAHRDLNPRRMLAAWLPW